MKIQITNQQKLISIQQSAVRNLILQLLSRAHPLDHDINWEHIAVHLVDDVNMQGAHACYFGKNTVTDVISQKYAPIPGEFGYSAEIIANAQQALRAKATAGWSWHKELSLYIAHGIDHLHGGLDDTPAQQMQMRRRELRWLRQIEKQGFSFETLGRANRPGEPNGRANVPLD